MFPIGISTCGSAPNEALFRSYAAAGVFAAELSPAQNGYDTLDYAAAAGAAAGAGVTLWSFHLQFMPFENVDVSSLSPQVRADTVKRLQGQIERAAAVGIGRFILHASGEPVAPGEREARMQCARESVFALAETAAACGGTLCVEDLPRSCLGRNSAEMLALTGVSPNVRVCFDTNHLLGEAPTDFIAALGEKIVTLHVSDYDFTDERHWLPGEGKLDWASVYAALRAVGYAGIWMYELGMRPKRDMPRTRDLTPADLARNAGEIFAGAYPLTRVR